MNEPTLGEQTRFWNDWVDRSHAWRSNPDNRRRAAYVLDEITASATPGMKILDVGCGSGWLALELARYGHVTATDLASDMIEQFKQQHPGVTSIGGDFLTLELPEQLYDFVTSLETIAHVPDQEAFASRLARIIRPNGTLVLTTQNEYVWKHTSWLAPPKPGQLRNWPSRQRLEELFSPWFNILKITTCAPGGNLGLPRLVNNRASTAVGEAILGQGRWTQVREQWGLGRSLVLVGRRKQE